MNKKRNWLSGTILAAAIVFMAAGAVYYAGFGPFDGAPAAFAAEDHSEHGEEKVQEKHSEDEHGKPAEGKPEEPCPHCTGEDAHGEEDDHSDHGEENEHAGHDKDSHADHDEDHDEEHDVHDVHNVHNVHEEDKHAAHAEDNHAAHGEEDAPAVDPHAGHDHGDDEGEEGLGFTEAEKKEFGIAIGMAGPGKLGVQQRFPGEVRINADKVAHIAPRAPGIVREVLKRVGDRVRAGEVMAWIESSELGAAKVDYLSKWTEVSCCSFDLARAEEIHKNTSEFLRALEGSPSIGDLGKIRAAGMGEQGTALVSAYAEYVFSRENYQREKDLYGRKISSREDYLAAENAYKKAEAKYAATRDTTAYRIEKNLLEAQQTRRMGRMALMGAERTLNLMGVSAAEIKELEDLAQGETLLADNEEECTDPNCENCKKEAEAAGHAGHACEKLGWYPLRATFDGVVIEKHLTLGEKHGDDSNTFTIADLSSVWVDVSVYQKNLPMVRKGQVIQISEGENGLSAQGAIEYISPLVDPKTRTVVARVELPNPLGRWRPGLFVDAYVSVGGETAALVAPKTAVQKLGGEDVVFVVEGEEYVSRPVTLGRGNSTHVEVLLGLKAGERFVADGAFELKAKIVTSGMDPHAGHGH